MNRLSVSDSNRLIDYRGGGGTSQKNYISNNAYFFWNIFSYENLTNISVTELLKNTRTLCVLFTRQLWLNIGMLLLKQNKGACLPMMNFKWEVIFCTINNMWLWILITHFKSYIYEIFWPPFYEKIVQIFVLNSSFFWWC